MDRTDICSVPSGINTILPAPGRCLSRCWRVNDCTETAVGFRHVMQRDEMTGTSPTHSLLIRDDVTLQLPVVIKRRSTAHVMQESYLVERLSQDKFRAQWHNGTAIYRPYWPVSLSKHKYWRTKLQPASTTSILIAGAPAKQQLKATVSPTMSVRPHGWQRLPQNGFSSNFISGT